MQKIYVKSKFNYLKLNLYSQSGSGRRKIHIESNSISDGGIIDAKYSMLDENISPHVKITFVPENTKKLVLLMYDLDAKQVIGKTFIHWFVVLDPNETIINENESVGEQMKNSYGKNGYGGPKPPPGMRHVYHFKIYAITDDLTFDSDKLYEYDELKKLLEKYDKNDTTDKFTAEFESVKVNLKKE